MKRTLTMIGVAVLVIGAAVSQAQGRQGAGAAGDPQRGGRPTMGQQFDGAGCGPNANAIDRGQGDRPGRGGQFMRGRGPGGGRPGGPGRMGGRGLCGLALTEDQQARIQALREESRRQIEAILTPEQLAKLHSRRGGGTGVR